MEKDWYQSKTVWVSLAGIVYAIGGYFSGNLDGTTAMTAAQVGLTGWFLRLGIGK